MFTFPPAKLGDVSALTIASSDLEVSFAFWQRLGFREVFRTDFPFPLIHISDGQLLILLRLMNQPYISLTYYVKEIDRVTGELESSGLVFADKRDIGAMMKRHLLQSPDGLNVALVTWLYGFAAPPGPSMLTMSPQDYANPAKYANQTAGMFGELAHPVKDLELSIAFWEKLGFNVLSKYAAPYPWSIMSDGVSVVGLHQSAQPYPAITYFAADMKSRTAKLIEDGLENFMPRDGSGNLDVTTPEGQHVFLFGL